MKINNDMQFYAHIHQTFSINLYICDLQINGCSVCYLKSSCDVEKPTIVDHMNICVHFHLAINNNIQRTA